MYVLIRLVLLTFFILGDVFAQNGEELQKCQSCQALDSLWDPDSNNGTCVLDVATTEADVLLKHFANCLCTDQVYTLYDQCQACAAPQDLPVDGLNLGPLDNFKGACSALSSDLASLSTKTGYDFYAGYTSILAPLATASLNFNGGLTNDVLGEEFIGAIGTAMYSIVATQPGPMIVTSIASTTPAKTSSPSSAISQSVNEPTPTQMPRSSSISSSVPTTSMSNAERTMEMREQGKWFALLLFACALIMIV